MGTYEIQIRNCILQIQNSVTSVSALRPRSSCLFVRLVLCTDLAMLAHSRFALRVSQVGKFPGRPNVAAAAPLAWRAVSSSTDVENHSDETTAMIHGLWALDAASSSLEPASTSLAGPRQAVQATHTCLTGHVRSLGEVTHIFEPEAMGTSVHYPSSYLEVRTRDIGRKEDLSVVVTESGFSISCSQIWVKKGSMVHRVSPFRV